MPACTLDAPAPRHYELRFRSLFREGRGYTFPCDASGQVAMSALSERALCNYLYARVLVGREFHHPEVGLCCSEPVAPAAPA